MMLCITTGSGSDAAAGSLDIQATYTLELAPVVLQRNQDPPENGSSRVEFHKAMVITMLRHGLRIDMQIN